MGGIGARQRGLKLPKLLNNVNQESKSFCNL
jgi:hypothetical protein